MTALKENQANISWIRSTKANGASKKQWLSGTHILLSTNEAQHFGKNSIP
jgi:hypothetical protein